MLANSPIQSSLQHLYRQLPAKTPRNNAIPSNSSRRQASKCLQQYNGGQVLGLSAAAQTDHIKRPIKEKNGEGQVEIHAFASHSIKGGTGRKDGRGYKRKNKHAQASNWKKLPGTSSRELRDKRIIIFKFRYLSQRYGRNSWGRNGALSMLSDPSPPSGFCQCHNS